VITRPNLVRVHDRGVRGGGGKGDSMKHFGDITKLNGAEYEERLRNQGAFYARNEDAENIDITARYQFNLKEDDE